MQDTVLESNKKGKGFSIIILDQQKFTDTCQWSMLSWNVKLLTSSWFCWCSKQELKKLLFFPSKMLQALDVHGGCNLTKYLSFSSHSLVFILG